MLNVGKYIPYMDPIIYITSTKHQTHGLKLEKNLQPSNISTTKKNITYTYILTIILDAQEIPTIFPPLKKKRNAIPWYPRSGVPTEFGCKFQDLKRQPIEAGSPSVKGPKSFQDPKSAMNSIRKGLLHRQLFFSTGTFCSKQVKVIINAKLDDAECVFFCFFFGKDRQLRLGKHWEKNIQLHLEKWTRLIC